MTAAALRILPILLWVYAVALICKATDPATQAIEIRSVKLIHVDIDDEIDRILAQ